jgi:hypothetical protein
MMTHKHLIRKRGWLPLMLVFLIGLSSSGTAARPASTALLIVPPIAQARAAPTARGMFYHQTLVATVPTDGVWLASSSDGQGMLCTDDQATLRFTARDRPALIWSHRFTSADRRSIACIAPLRLTLPAAGEEYQIEVILEDLQPDTYSSRPYYLVFTTGTIERAASAQLPATPHPTAALAPTALSTAAMVATLPPAPTAPPTAAAPTAAMLPIAPPNVPDAAGHMLAGGGLRIVLLVGVVVFLIMAAIAIRGRRVRYGAASQPSLAGIVYLFDQETCEARTEILPDDVRRLHIRRQPLGLAALPSDAPGGASIAQIWSTDNGLVIEDLTAPGPTPLTHDRPYTLAGGAVILRYRGPGVRG